MQAGKLETAFRLFKQMRHKKLKPNVITFGTLMHACATANNVSSAVSLLQVMKSAGVQPNAEIYTSFINALFRAGTKESLQHAFQVGISVYAQYLDLGGRDHCTNMLCHLTDTR